MGKALAFVFCTAMFTLTALAGTITVTNPQNGMTCWFENFLNVKWTYSGIPDSTTVKVLLFQNGAYKAHLQTGIPIANKLYSLPLPSPIPSGSGYKIRVQTEEPAGTSSMGESGTFYWYPARLVNLYPPAQDFELKLKLDSKCVIWWASFSSVAFVPHTCRLVLKRNGVVQGVIADNIACSTYKDSYTYEWTVGKLLSGTVPAGGGYCIQVVFKPAPGGEFSDEWSPFAIVSSTTDLRKVVAKKILIPTGG